MGIASLILAIVSIVFTFIPLGGVASGIIALVCAIIGLILGVMARKNPQQRGLGTAGMVISIIALVIAAIGIIAVIACVGMIGSAAKELGVDLSDLTGVFRAFF